MEIVLKQAITETNCGLTGVGKSRNNIFGFRNKGGYIYFKTIIVVIYSLTKCYKYNSTNTK